MSRKKKEHKKALHESKDLNVYEGCPFCMCMIIAFSVFGHGVFGHLGIFLTSYSFYSERGVLFGSKGKIVYVEKLSFYYKHVV